MILFQTARAHALHAHYTVPCLAVVAHAHRVSFAADIQLKVRHGSLVAIVGGVGAGTGASWNN
jgi:ABC-type glutathione transport system ATPase component